MTVQIKVQSFPLFAVNCIKINDGVSFNKNCLFCQRCINICPNNAFLLKNKEIIQYKPDFKRIIKTI